MVQQAQNSKAPGQRLADRAAGWLFWFALGTAALTAIAVNCLQDARELTDVLFGIHALMLQALRGKAAVLEGE